ncbi:VP3 [Orungo virus]|uniref:VP3 n=1 Tax=Orungo virus TaxID=40058 RepID=W5QLW7_9REOV|nr:VP3 [Orungo virus]AFX73389.1 VP3 [Orungo virus]
MAHADAKGSDPEREALRKNPYLDGDVLGTAGGQVLSVFALTEILQKVRQTQAELAAHAIDLDGPVPEITGVIKKIAELVDTVPYEVRDSPPISYKTLSMQSRDFVIQVDQYYEQISQIGGDVGEDEPMEFYKTMLEKVRYLRKSGAFILRGIKTRDYRGNEVAEPEALGVEFREVLSNFIAADRQVIQNALDAAIVENGQVGDRAVDVYMAAVSEPWYRIYNRLQAYIEVTQLRELRRAMEWLNALGRRKRVEYDDSFLTDFRARDTVWVQTQQLPVNARVIWEVPRSYIANLMMNIALCLPLGDFIAPNPRIGSITITQRITMTTPFGMMSGMTPTSMQMDDVKKIYLALLFPGQIVLNIKPDPAHSIDPVLRMVSGVLGHLMFTYGPRFTNITATTSQLLDSALSDYFLYMQNSRVPVVYGPTGLPLDFRIGGRQGYDCNNLRGDPQTGRGYNGWGVVDVDRRAPSPYDLVQRFIRYCNIDSREIIDPRTFGFNMNYPLYMEMIRALVAGGKDQEAAYLRQMLPFHMIRFARINQIINEDLLSAFSLPDEDFDALFFNMLRGEYGKAEPIVLDISWASIWFAFNRYFDPVQRSDLLSVAPMIEAVYASEISILQLDMINLQQLRARAPDMLINATPSQFWKAALASAAEPVVELMNLSQSFRFINVRDIIQWTRTREVQPSLALTLEREAWAVAADFEELMLVNHVYFHRSVVPEPQLDDIDEFRRQGFLYTNLLEAAPPRLLITNYDYNVALLQANLGQFKSALRRILDDGGWVMFGGMLRNVRLKIYDSKPGEDVLSELPYLYSEKVENGLRFVSLKYARRATIYFLMYKVEYSNTPDALISVNPTYTMTKIYTNKRLVRKVRSPDVLNIVNKRVVAYKTKMRLIDITSALRLGVKLAAPTV